MSGSFSFIVCASSLLLIYVYIPEIHGRSVIDPCRLPKVTGPCRGCRHRWYYNSASNTCHRFCFGGCRGNRNNFPSAVTCKRRCVRRKACPLVRCARHCPHGFQKNSRGCTTCRCNPPVPCLRIMCRRRCRHGFQKNSDGCPICRCNPPPHVPCPRIMCRKHCRHGFQKNSDGCPICRCNPPPHVSSDVCNLSTKRGKCRAHIRRYYYDFRRGSCHTFIYSGCQGNKNNFHSLAQCMQACEYYEDDVSSDVCHWEKASGRCRARHQRYYYDFVSLTCKSFFYGGCGGNKNNFPTLAKCKQACLPHEQEDICLLPSEHGPCRARHTRWYFSEKDGRCHTFVYGGCRGNKNNFKSKRECENACHH